MLMVFDRILSLLDVLLTTVHIAIDVIALAITAKKGKRLSDEPPSKP